EVEEVPLEVRQPLDLLFTHVGPDLRRARCLRRRRDDGDAGDLRGGFLNGEVECQRLADPDGDVPRLRAEPDAPDRELVVAGPKAGERVEATRVGNGPAVCS